MSEELSVLQPNELSSLAEAEDILAQVQHGILQEQVESHADLASLTQRYQELRAQTQGAIKSDIPALLDQMHNQMSLAQRAKPKGLPSPESPYFGALELQEGQKRRWVLIGSTPLLSKHCPYPIIDWRTAPLAKIFFQHREGENYEIQLPGRLATGQILQRQILSIARGKLVQLHSPRGQFRWQKESGWSKTAGVQQRLAGGEAVAVQGFRLGSGETGMPAPEIAALLDPAQFRILNESEDQPLLVIGQAGSGKTTVAMHRLAVLHARDAERFAQEKMAVIVPENGLANLSKRLLRLLSLDAVTAKTFDQWAEQQVRRMLTALPPKIYEDTPYVIGQMKRHRAMLAAIDAYLEERKQDLLRRLAKRFPYLSSDLGTFVAKSHWSLSSFVHRIQKHLLQNREPKLAGHEQRFQDFFDKEVASLSKVANDRKSLLSSETLMMTHLAPVFGERSVQQLLTHSRLQNSSAASQRFRDVDEDRRIALDGQDLDCSTPDEISSTLDVEDFPILMELIYRNFGTIQTARSQLQTWAHAVVDEAQEFAPLELRIIGHSLASPASVTVAGDGLQNTDVGSYFQDWQQTIADLGLGAIDSHQLLTSYRCPRPVAELAQAVLGPLATQPLTSVREGLPVQFSRLEGIGQALIFLADELGGLMQREPYCTVAVISRDEETAERCAAALSHLTDSRLVTDGNFPFRPGIDITTAQQVKGLEFDYVVVPDADSKTYGDDHLSRRALHLVCTRACHQLWLLSAGTPSPLLNWPQ